MKKADWLKRAQELGVPGRSKMNVHELSAAVIDAERHDARTSAPVEVAPETEEQCEPSRIVPNRRESRARRLNLGRLRNDGTPVGGHTPTFNRADRTERSVIAGEQGKHYGWRNPDAKRVHTKPQDAGFSNIPAGPRTVPVNVIHSGN